MIHENSWARHVGNSEAPPLMTSSLVSSSVPLSQPWVWSSSLLSSSVPLLQPWVWSNSLLSSSVPLSHSHGCGHPLFFPHQSLSHTAMGVVLLLSLICPSLTKTKLVTFLREDVELGVFSTTPMASWEQGQSSLFNSQTVTCTTETQNKHSLFIS